MNHESIEGTCWADEREATVIFPTLLMAALQFYLTPLDKLLKTKK